MKVTKIKGRYFFSVEKMYSGMRVVASGLAVWMVILLGMPSAVLPPKKKLDEVKKIVIDPGHGGMDPGCSFQEQIFEKDVTLAIGLKLGKYLEDSMKDVTVLYTRKTDKSLKLWERPDYANKNEADLFISIHCNANNNNKAKGSETYFMGLHKTDGNLSVAKRENSAITYESDYKDNARYGGFDPDSPEGHIIFSLVQNAFMKQSLKFSSLVEEETNKRSTIKSKGVKQAGFLVLWKTSMPAVLIETGFLTNPSDKEYLKSEEGQGVIAYSVFQAIRSYKQSIEKKK